MYALLHGRSFHSLGDGTASVAALVDRVAGLGFRALALTDVETLAGQIEFHHAARARGLQPITGVELRGGFSAGYGGSPHGRLVLLARDRRGYESLCRIVTARRDSPVDATPDPLRCLDAFPSGLFYLSDDPEVLRRLRAGGVAPGDFRLLLDRPGALEDGGVAAVADADVSLLDPDDAALRRLVAAIRARRTVDASPADYPPGRALPAVDEFRARFAARPEALEETVRLAAACTLDLTVATPAPPTGDHVDADAALDDLTARCRDALRALPEESVRNDRLTRELLAVAQAGIAGYLLVVADVVTEARRRGIAITARGSVSGSLVAYLLGLTPIDPVTHGLYFERFLHPRRAHPPDIDLDVASDRRDELLDWIFARFGEGRVAMVAAHQTFGRRAAFREGLRAFGMELAAIDRFIQAFPGTEADPDWPGPLPLQLLPGRFHGAVPLIERLIGLPRHLSVHPGGVVIAETRVDAYAPLERAAKGVPVIQYDMTSAGRLGLVKFDLLGNRALAAQAEAERLIGHPVHAPDGDPVTIAALRAGNTIGCFQIETPVMRGVLKRLPVRGIADVRAALAIVRPGPSAGDAKTEFLRRANGESPRLAPHPRLAERLRETYGMLLFDEDLMTAMTGLTGWPLAVADEVRSALIASDPGSPARLSLRRRFHVAVTHAGVARGDAERVWQLLERFAACSFSKAHAASHARLAWDAVFLKTHHPAAFACGVLNHYGGHYPLRAIVSEFMRCGLTLLAPHVNHSGLGHQLEGGGVRLGLCAVKFLTSRNRQWILRERPFHDLRELVTRISLSVAELESLILSGACDDLAPLARAAYPFAHEELLTRWKRQPGVAGLDGFVARSARGQFAETYRALARIRNELRFLGMHVSDHPMRVLRDEALRCGGVTTREASGRSGQEVEVAAVPIAARRHIDRHGRAFHFLTLEDHEGLLEAVVPDGLLPDTSPGGALLLRGRVEGDAATPTLRVVGVLPFQLRPDPHRVAETV